MPLEGEAAAAVGEWAARRGAFKDEDSYNSDLLDGPTGKRVVALLRQIQTTMLPRTCSDASRRSTGPLPSRALPA